MGSGSIDIDGHVDEIQVGSVGSSLDVSGGMDTASLDSVGLLANGKVAIDDSADGIRERTGCDDLEDAFVRAIRMVEPA